MTGSGNLSAIRSFAGQLSATVRPGAQPWTARGRGIAEPFPAAIPNSARRNVCRGSDADPGPAHRRAVRDDRVADCRLRCWMPPVAGEAVRPARIGGTSMRQPRLCGEPAATSLAQPLGTADEGRAACLQSVSDPRRVDRGVDGAAAADRGDGGSTPSMSTRFTIPVLRQPLRRQGLLQPEPPLSR